MKKLIIISLILSACSAQWHVKRALKKDPTIQQEVEYVDTLTLTKTVIDTVHTSDSTFYIQVKEMSYDTVIKMMYQKYDFSEMKNWFQTWQEEKTERVIVRNVRRENETEIKQQGRTDRSEIRNDRKEKNGNRWWFAFVIAGAVMTMLIRILWTRVKPWINN